MITLRTSTTTVASVWLVLFLGLFTAQSYGQDTETCQICHGDEALLEDSDSRRLFVDPDHYDSSVHGIFSCVDCHQDVAAMDPFAHEPELEAVDCGMCHSGIQEEFQGSLHAYAGARGNERAPDCVDCHGTHDILPAIDADSPTHRLNISSMCAVCHGEAGLLTDDLVRLPQSVTSYAQSVHGQALKRGIETAAVCTDCHGVHDLKGGLDPTSKTHPMNVSATCGSCHGDIQSQYDQSIHGRALQAGISDSPTCNTCHGEHLVLSPGSPQATTYASQLAAETCGRCHEDSRIIEKYGLADYVVDTYVDSYHGWANRWQSEESATCISCHTAHWVLPPRDPASTISPTNVIETCAQCHPGADETFSLSYTHRTASITANSITSWIEYIYIVLIGVVIGGMALHNIIVINYYLVEKRLREKGVPSVVRMDRTQIAQHILLAVAFIVLVITGFALRFPDAWWVRPLAGLGMTEGLRSLIHRIFAVVLIGVSVSHVLYVVFSLRGRKEFSAMMPRWRDFTDLFTNLSFYLRLRKSKPDFDRYDYTQKAEYWALVWGTVLMALTGFVLWFPSTAVRWMPSWIVLASEVIHYYEAWLATLAIIIWHFFFVLFHPEVYPMSWTWISGKMTREEVMHHHPGWFREITSSADENAEEETG